MSLELGNKTGVNRNQIGAKGAKYLKDLLISNQILTFLGLRANSLGDQGLHQIALGLRENSGL